MIRTRAALTISSQRKGAAFAKRAACGVQLGAQR